MHDEVGEDSLPARDGVDFLAYELDRLMKVAKISSSKMGRMLGAKTSNVTAWRIGKHVPTVFYIRRMAKILRVSYLSLVAPIYDSDREEIAEAAVDKLSRPEGVLIREMGKLSQSQREALVERALGWIDASLTIRNR